MTDEPGSSGSPGGDRHTLEPERVSVAPGPGDVPERRGDSFDLSEWILAATSEAVVAIDRDARVTFWNPAAEKLYGVPASDAIGRPLRECYEYEFESPEQERQAYEALEKRGRWRGDNVHMTRAGRRIPVAATISRIPEEHGGGYFAMIRNIRLRKSAETALRVSQERERARTLELETLMRAAPAVIWISHDSEGRVVTGNPASDRLLHLPEGANPSASAPGANHRGWREMRNGAEIPASELPVQVAARGTEVRDAELSLVFDDGEVRHILGNAAPLRAQDGRVTGSIGAFVDITARKKAEEALQEALRRKDEFLAMLAHELRNPLGAITHALELLRSSLPSGAPGAWERGVVERQVAHLTQIVDDLLDVSRLTRGKIQLKKGPLPVAAAIALAIETSRAAIDARGQQIFASVPEGIWVDGDVNRLAQIVANLLSNASRYSPDRTRIWLSLETHGGEAVIRVRDEGIGIRPEMLSQIFDLFRQGEPGLDRSEGGLGIGLTLVQSLVRLHGGTVHAESRGLGLGSEFVIRLPAIPAPVREEERRMAAFKEETVWRVLVVDDNEDSARGLAQLLEVAGHEVRVAHEAASALRMLSEFRPDVAVLDIGLPGMDGYELARRIRREADLGPVLLIALTGYGQEQDRRRALEAGFDHHVVKPVRADVLLATFDRLAASRRSGPTASGSELPASLAD